MLFCVWFAQKHEGMADQDIKAQCLHYQGRSRRTPPIAVFRHSFGNSDELFVVAIMSSSSDPVVMDGDRSPTIVACAVVLTVFALAVVGLRFYVRCKMVRSVESEDWLMLVSMVRFPRIDTNRATIT